MNRTIPHINPAATCRHCPHARISATRQAFGGGVDVGHFCDITGLSVKLDNECNIVQLPPGRETANKRRADTHRKGHPEHDLQVAYVAWFRAEYPEDAAMLFAVPNGGSRNAIEAKRLKDEGATAGVSDLIYLEARGGYGALCIETKTRRKGSGQSDKQKEWQRQAEAHGNKYVVARDLAAFCREIVAYKRLPLTRNNQRVTLSGSDIIAAQMARKTPKDSKF